MSAVTQQVLAGLTAAAAAPAAIAFGNHYESTADVTNSTYTFASAAIGTASSDRYVAIGIYGRGSTSGTASVTVAGQSCSILVNGNAGGANECQIWITDAPVTSGTTASVVVTTNGSWSNCGISTYALTGLQSIVPTATVTTTTNNSARSLAIDAGGVAICVGYSAATSTFTTTGMTEDADVTVESTVASGTAGSASSATAQTLSVTINASTASNFRAAMVALR